MHFCIESLLYCLSVEYKVYKYNNFYINYNNIHIFIKKVYIYIYTYLKLYNYINILITKLLFFN